MPDTDIIPRPGWRARLALVAGLARASMFYALHPRAPLPGNQGQVALSIRVPKSARGSQLTALAEIADRLHTTEQPADLDCTIAERWFGSVRVVASVRGPGYTAELVRRRYPLPAAGDATVSGSAG